MFRRKTRSPHPATRITITPHQQRIIQLVSQGYTSQQIAHQLGIRPCSVNTQLNRLYRKLGVNSRPQCIARAYELNILTS